MTSPVLLEMTAVLRTFVPSAVSPSMGTMTESSSSASGFAASAARAFFFVYFFASA